MKRHEEPSPIADAVAASLIKAVEADALPPALAQSPAGPALEQLRRVCRDVRRARADQGAPPKRKAS